MPIPSNLLAQLSASVTRATPHFFGIRETLTRYPCYAPTYNDLGNRGSD
jgi:hypothetical protein